MTDDVTAADIIQGLNKRTQQALPAVTGNIDEDPERAQRAMDLAQATGVPSTAIFGDLDEFERQHKAAMASSIVQGNPHLSDFVQSNPMVPKIANDDYGNLDEVSHKLSTLGWLGQTAINSARAMANAPDAFGKEGLGSWISPEDWHNHPFWASVISVAGALPEMGARTLNAVGTEVATDILGKEKGEQAVQTLMDPGLQASLEGIGPPGAAAAGLLGVVSKFRPLAERAAPWLNAAREPPATVLPEYDKYRAEQNATQLDQLKEVTDAAQQSVLRDRNPELFKQFIDQHTDAEIGVSGEVVAKLYGDKLPEADDNLLGWVPGIEDKLNLARATGDDVAIPLSDWIAKVDPEVMKGLEDDIRVHPDGITKNEVKVAEEQEEARRDLHEQGQPEVVEGAEAPAPYKPAEPLDDLVAQTRSASALEPLFSVGDRKLQLERIGANVLEENKTVMERFGPEHGFHDFDIKDEQGRSVGTLNLSSQKGGKQLYVEMINGIGGLGPRDFGPALMRSLLKQLKAEFPNAESITGHRVSGAREKAGSYMASSASPVVKLDALDTQSAHNALRQIFENGQWETYSSNLKGYIKPDIARTPPQRELVGILNDEFNRLVPNKARLGIADTIKADTKGLAGQRAGEDIRVGGAYIPYRDAYPIILAALDSDDAVGGLRHEVTHHLRQYGFYTKEEWSTLEAQALAGGWLSKYNIDRRYPTGSPALKLEESVAEAFMDWRKQRDSLEARAREIAQIPSPLDAIFQKMKDFFDGIKNRISQLLGKDATWEDIFKKVDTGEVGGREGTEPLDPRAFNEKLSVAEPPEGGSRVFERAAALGMTTDQFKAYDKLIAERHTKDIEAATRRATEEQAREHTKQWKEDRKALRVEVASNIKQRPDVAADLFFGAGELYGKKVPLGSVKLDAEALTDAQKAGLPRNYYGEHGLHPDDVANLFGYGSGDAMVERLVQYNTAKLQAGGMSAKDFVSRVTDIETDRQMQARYGSLDENIVDAVKEQVSGETQQNILHEETMALGMRVGQAPLEKGTVINQLRDAFAKMPLGSVSSDSYMRAAGKAGRQAELSLLANDPAGAFRAKQQQYYATVIANEAAKLEKDLGKFDKVANRFSKREIDTIDPEYTNFIHDILLRVGRPVRRSIQDLETEIQAGEHKDLQSFVEGKRGFYLREVDVDEFLYNQSFRKKFDDLTVDEFRGVNDSIKSLIANGRDELKINNAGKTEDLSVVRKKMIDQLKEFDEKEFDAKGGRKMGVLPASTAAALRTYGIDHLQMETIFNRWDKGDPNGVFQQYVLRDLVDASNSESAKRKSYADRLLALDDKADLKKSVENPLFKVPGTDQFLPLTRANLRAILLNAGNDSNLLKMAKGYDIRTEQLTAWLHQHATKEDWDWAQKMGDIFKDISKESAVMYRNLSGRAPQIIDLKPVETPHGQYPGWYYPLIAHPEFEGAVKKMMGKDALEQEGFVRATTANGYTKARTGAVYPLALDLDMLPYRMGQMIHDVEMRPAVINASKIFYDKDVRQTIANRFGNEWRDMMVPYLIDVANAANYTTKAQKQMQSWSEFFRQNLITTLVGLNPGTFMKHTPTALVQSVREVGTERFLQAVRGLWSVNERTGESNWQFARSTSQELQRRHSHFMETLGGAADALVPQKGFATLRQTVNYYASMPVAMGDLASAVPTWLAQYSKSIEEGATHGDAAYMADRAVRRAHGSTAITNRSAVMRGGSYSPWLASVYGFFNHIMNRQYEMIWKSGEALDMAKEGQYSSAMKAGVGLTASLFAYVIAPALIEEVLAPQQSDPKDSWGKKAAKSLTFTLGASWVGIRDLTNAMLNGRDPVLGLTGTAFKTLTDVTRDFAKDKPLSPAHAGKTIRDATMVAGSLTGMVPAQAGRVAQFGHGVAAGQERPKGPWGWLTGARYGTLKGHPATGAEWWRHHIGGH